MIANNRFSITLWITIIGLSLNLLSKITEKYTTVGELYPFFSWSLVSSAMKKEDFKKKYYICEVYYQNSGQQKWNKLPFFEYKHCKPLAELLKKNDSAMFSGSKVNIVVKKDLSKGFAKYKVVMESFTVAELIKDSSQYDKKTICLIER